MISTYDFSMVRGQTKPLLFTVRYARGYPSVGGQVVDLTGATAYFRVRPDMKAAPVVSLSSATTGIVIATQTGSTKGQFTVTIVPNDTKDLPIVSGDDYIWDSWVVLATGEKFPVIAPSRVILIPEVTTF